MHARTRARTNARTHARAHARTHARLRPGAATVCPALVLRRLNFLAPSRRLLRAATWRCASSPRRLNARPTARCSLQRHTRVRRQSLLPQPGPPTPEGSALTRMDARTALQTVLHRGTRVATWAARVRRCTVRHPARRSTAAVVPVMGTPATAASARLLPIGHFVNHAWRRSCACSSRTGVSFSALCPSRPRSACRLRSTATARCRRRCCRGGGMK
eukprot:4781980-Pleurochrysis_carterae.AAC.1